MNKHALTIAALLGGLLLTPAASAAPFLIINQDVPAAQPDGLVGSLSRPASAGKIEFESADDFRTSAPATALTSATFTGLITGTTTLPTINQVAVEIYRIFPADSNTVRTIQVPSRVNSPSDVEFDNTGRTSLAGGGLTFSTTLLNSNFTAAQSVANVITPCPAPPPGAVPPFCGGAGGLIRGVEVQFNVTFTNPILLPADHYFFVPQVELAGAGTDFFWLSTSTPKPAPPGDLQTWIRSDTSDPDWERIGTDITGLPASNPTGFNALFSLTAVVAEPSVLLLLTPALLLLGRLQRRQSLA
jgi:hypothetical protein